MPRRRAATEVFPGQRLFKSTVRIGSNNRHALTIFVLVRGFDFLRRRPSRHPSNRGYSQQQGKCDTQDRNRIVLKRRFHKG